MDFIVNEHLKVDGRDRVLFYPEDFSSPAYIVPSRRLAPRILLLSRLHRCSIFFSIGLFILVYRLTPGDPFDWSQGLRPFFTFLATVVFLAYLQRGLERWWPKYAQRLAQQLERADEGLSS